MEAPEIEQIYLNDINFTAIEMAKNEGWIKFVSFQMFFHHKQSAQILSRAW